MKIRSPFLTRSIAWLAAATLKLLARTLRWRGVCEVPLTDCSQPGTRNFIYVLWHDAIILPVAHLSRGRADVVALVSRHQDGTYLDHFMRHVGIRSIRGSSRHGGDQALRELIRFASKSSVFITPDGPRGPRRQLKDGPIFLASQTGLPIIPLVSYAERAWRIPGSWTDLTIPKPFSRAFYVLGQPFHVPPDLGRDEVRRYRDLLQAEMDRVEAKVLGMARGDASQAALRRAA